MNRTSQILQEFCGVKDDIQFSLVQGHRKSLLPHGFHGEKPETALKDLKQRMGPTAPGGRRV